MATMMMVGPAVVVIEAVLPVIVTIVVVDCLLGSARWRF